MLFGSVFQAFAAFELVRLVKWFLCYTKMSDLHIVSEDFSTEARDEAWDRLKVTCCQPFRKDVQFGVSMLQIWSVDPSDATSSSTDQGLHMKVSIQHWPDHHIRQFFYL